MALDINGVGQNSFKIDDIDIDNLYIDGVLVWSSEVEPPPVNTKPVISVIGDNPTYLVLNGSAYVEQGATATDAEDGDITNDIVIGGDTPDVSVEGYYYVSYNVSDSEGLAADERTRTVSVYAVTIPKYELTEPLINDGTFDYVDDSNNPELTYNGKLTESDGTTPYLPTELQYIPAQSLLELASGRMMDTQYEITDTNTYGLYGIYSANGNSVYNIWALDVTSATTGILYEGDQDTPISRTGEITIAIDPGTYKITDGRPYWMPVDANWEETPLPDVAIDVTDGVNTPANGGVSPNTPLVGDGSDESALLNTIAADTNITNWYFPTGKSFLLTQITIPMHLDAVYGDGTIISKEYDNGTVTYGAFRIIYGCKDNFIFDGLSFETENTTWIPTHSSYGHITFYGNTTFTGLEIRNCTFDMEHFNMNGISGYEEDVVMSNIRIHNNTFTNITRFGIEIGNFEFRTPEGTNRNLTSLHINDNNFSSDGISGIGVSFVGTRAGVGDTGAKDGTENYVYNNSFTNLSWAMEVSNTSGAYVHNNIATEISGYLYINEQNSDSPTGKNYIFNNDLKSSGDDAAILIRDGSNDEIYGNFFDALIRIETTTFGSMGMNIHDNTLVWSPSVSGGYSTLVNNITQGSLVLQDNDIYTGIEIGRGILFSGTTTGVSAINNNIYMEYATGTCVDDLSSGTNTASGNACTLNYTGEIPTSRPGAGLLPWEETPLPLVAIDVTDGVNTPANGGVSPNTPLVGDGVTDDTAALNAIKADTNITNWYFPVGKSFLLQNINVPTHIEAIYGAGSIIAKAYNNGAGDKSIFGAFTCTLGADNLIFDGLSFIAEDSVEWIEYSWYGLITLPERTGAYNNMEIRNCSFNMINHLMQGIKIMAGDGVISGLRIHNNTFTNINRFGVEIGDWDTTPLGTRRQLIGTHINDNHFTNALEAGYGVSFVSTYAGAGLTGEKDGTENSIYNNIVDGDIGSAYEISATSGLYLHNNEAIGMTKYLVLFEGNAAYDVLGKSFVFNNDLKGNPDSELGADLLYRNSMVCETYDNYFGGRMTISDDTGEETSVNLHDNTFVHSLTGASPNIISVANISVGTTLLDNNDLYVPIQTGRGFYLVGTTTGCNTTNNNINLIKDTGTCIDDVSTGTNTESGNTCTLGYTGEIPTSRPGAGLLP